MRDGHGRGGAPSKADHQTLSIRRRSSYSKVRVVNSRTRRLHHKSTRQLHGQTRRLKTNLFLTALRFKRMTRQRSNLFTRLARHFIIVNTRVTRCVTSNLTGQCLSKFINNFHNYQRKSYKGTFHIFLPPCTNRYNLTLIFNLFNHTNARRLLLNRRRHTTLN